MNWIYTSLQWYGAFFLLGIIFFPITQKIFGRFFPDLGYAISKTLAILFLSYTVFLLGILKILPFSQLSLIFLLLIFALLNFLIIKKVKISITNKELPILFLIIFEEFLFLLALLFWAFVRGQEPSIRGLEKFMDFGFISSILRSKYFPPLDIWLSAETGKSNGYYINYYYFGHLTGAILIKLTGIKATIGYNLILASTFALTVIQSFSLVIGTIFQYQTKIKNFAFDSFNTIKNVFFGLVGSFIVSLGGNLHTIYVFTKGYPNESPIPFWEILSWYNPGKYWYPNATRFIPDTIHEFPSYSWVVADMHGHVFDIPFVLFTLAFLFIFYIQSRKGLNTNFKKVKNYRLKFELGPFSLNISIPVIAINVINITPIIFLGFLTAVHYMTNAFDGPIYILLIIIVLYFISGLTKSFFISIFYLISSFILFALPFSIYFKPFVTGIGVNCSPSFLVKIGKIGPFLFEKGNCQVSPIWMLFLLWGFFWINFILFLVVRRLEDKKTVVDHFFLIIFSFATFLLIIPEFFYIKDIYPQHFRANTMFKLGYQAFIMMGIASAFTFYKIKHLANKINRLLVFIFIFFFFFIAIYPLYSIPSYYGQLDRPVELDGAKWMVDVISSDGLIPEDQEIIDFINSRIKGQPVILEAQGDSYTDFERMSAYTGLPTVAGWWVHEWLWRGSADVVGERIPDIANIYESEDLTLTKELLRKYNVSYVIVSGIEKKKYPKLQKNKFSRIGKLIFETSKKQGALYQLSL
ncbi:hypothetical protein A2954_07470 [Candidatus Roizmanbacteria bacterium RIFCSPLOWO2_01_FULL_37_12]|uniref:YYY membrane protein n=1 Tax=Candidatus Roizmanbacteria bacterium RIFCSPLOWO2_01_FULL_37_12 TaxID=1802056 RepID=A0A1F7IEA9_9BACT|nr:MAG: hypothetical protein A3D76_04580 [Candidatus Roizmanbacteria bacterium RIFCSPHIGHO2_02_FULL_37_9b]OGK41688.1 MAG: hypothetical protein A2954_07470 [Candidatus Roizmanbacteria bacterium RIFCSPLOWO2_01_FULL_37_12]